MIKEFQFENRFLSNFYPSDFAFEGIVFSTNEHFYQAMKCRNHTDMLKVIKAETPGQAKRLGREIEMRIDWEEIKEEIMFTGLLLKFTQNQDLKNKLIKTGNHVLVEGNKWHDNFWGNCYCERCKNIRGLNKLGNQLMDIREMFNRFKMFI